MQQALLVSTISLISVTLHFMRASLDNINDAGDFHTDAILSIEDVMHVSPRCAHQVRTTLALAIPPFCVVILFKSVSYTGR